MTTPAPRPALKKSADAHIHPAAPGAGSSVHTLRPAPPEDPEAPGPEGGASPPRDGADTALSHRLSGPLHGTTSDSLRNATRKARRPPKGKAADKPVDLGVKVPKSVRKDFRAAVKADKKDPDAVVTALLKAWLGT
jgi:hypothetical protein